jgi:hypothetical protein
MSNEKCLGKVFKVLECLGKVFKVLKGMQQKVSFEMRFESVVMNSR